MNDYIGGFIQWSYDNLATKADGTLGGHSSIDNTDIRAAYKYSPVDAAIPEWIFGATLNNNPTMQDPWNSTPAWSYPYTSSPLAMTPSAATIIDGGLAQQVAGLGAYAYWQKALYFEFSAYRTANVAGNVLRAGLPYNSPGGVLAITNFNPYWRVVDIGSESSDRPRGRLYFGVVPAEALRAQHPGRTRDARWNTAG